MRSRAGKRSAAKTVAIAEVLSAQQERRGAPAAARDAAAKLGDPETVAVVTGQQAGAFGGPLFTLLKAVTAIQLARRVSAEQGVRRCRCSGWMPRITTGKKCGRVPCSMPSSSRARSRWPTRRRRRTARRGADAGRTHRAEPLGALATRCRDTDFSEMVLSSLARCLPARHRHGGARSPAGSRRCSGRTVSSSSSRPIRQQSSWRRRCSCASCASRDARRRSPPRPAQQLPRRAATSRRSCRSRTAWPVSLERRTPRRSVVRATTSSLAIRR